MPNGPTIAVTHLEDHMLNTLPHDSQPFRQINLKEYSAQADKT